MFIKMKTPYICKECGYCCPDSCDLYSKDGCKDYKNRKEVCKRLFCEPIERLRRKLTMSIPCVLESS